MARHPSPVATGAGSNGVYSHRGGWIDMPVEWEPKETAAVPGQPMEGRLVRLVDYARRRVALRNGAGEMPLIKAASAQTDLRDLLRDDPTLFEALRALADGRREEVSREQVKGLREWGVVTGSGRVRGDLQMVLKASYEGKDGKPSIVGLAEMVMPADAAAARRLLAEEAERLQQLEASIQRRRREKGEGQGRG
jgi:hypothetical protein